MKLANKRKKQYLKYFKFFAFAQITTLLVAIAINTILLLPNDFKAKHIDYRACLEKQKQATTSTINTCIEPYSNN